jgi:hypothetical protein
MDDARKIPLMLHALIETFAAISFVTQPKKQLPGASEEARLILRSYGGLLLSLNGVCWAIVSKPGFDGTARLCTVFIASYHLWPIARAYMRIRSGLGIREQSRRVLGGPWVHLVVHVFLFAALLGVSLLNIGGNKTEL